MDFRQKQNMRFQLRKIHKSNMEGKKNKKLKDMCEQQQVGWLKIRRIMQMNTLSEIFSLPFNLHYCMLTNSVAFFSPQFRCPCSSLYFFLLLRSSSSYSSPLLIKLNWSISGSFICLKFLKDNGHNYICVWTHLWENVDIFMHMQQCIFYK